MIYSNPIHEHNIGLNKKKDGSTMAYEYSKRILHSPTSFYMKLFLNVIWDDMNIILQYEILIKLIIL